MKLFNQDRAVGAAAAVVLCFTIGLVAIVMSNGFARVSAAQEGMRSGPITDSVIAPATALGDAFAMVAAHVQPAVVSVYSEKVAKSTTGDSPTPFGDDDLRRFFGRQFPMPGPGQRDPRPQRGMGSGMIVDADGTILTNHHVVGDMTELKVKLADDRQFEAEVVATDPMTDVAVIRIKGGVPPDLPTVRLGDSDTLHAGGLVLAIGAPFGLTQTVTHGIISATGRSNVGIADFEDFLQTDTPINPGNSGGPLVNMRGEVIGMNSAIATRVGQSAGVGFAIPINMIKSMLPTLVAGQPITRGMLGVIVQEVDQDLARQFQLPDTKGAIVAQVNPSTAAEKAGVEVGDVIVSFDGKPVVNTRDLRNRVAATAVGSKVELELIRAGEERTLEVRIGELPSAAVEAGSSRAEDGASDRIADLGLTAQTLTPDLAREFEIQADRGVVITAVKRGTPAVDAGLQPGDLIVQAQRRPVARIEELRDAIARTSKGTNILLLVKREGASFFAVLPAR